MPSARYLCLRTTVTYVSGLYTERVTNGFRQEAEERTGIQLCKEHPHERALALIGAVLELQPLLIAQEAILSGAVGKLLDHAAQEVTVQEVIKDNVRERRVCLVPFSKRIAGGPALIGIETPISP